MEGVEEGSEGEKPENPDFARFRQFLKNGDLLINRIFFIGRYDIRRRAEKEIGGLAAMGREKWPSA